MILTILAWIGIGIALFILVLMVIPIRIFAGGTIDDHKGFEYQLVIDWALGLFSIRVQSGRSAGIYFTGLRLCPVPFKPSREKKQKQRWFDRFNTGNGVMLNNPPHYCAVVGIEPVCETIGALREIMGVTIGAECCYLSIKSIELS